MPLEMEAPEQIEQPAVKLFTEPTAATAAANLLESDDDGDAVDEPQREGAEEMTVRLTRDVTDEPAKFAGHAGETFSAYLDADGNVWIPLATNDIMLEAEEFEIVEPLQETMEEVAAMPTPATQEEVIELVAAVAEEIRKETPPATETVATRTPAVPAFTTPAIPSPPADDYAARRRDYLRQKDILQEQIAALMIEQAKLKEQVKRAKKEAEVYVEQLNELIDGWEHPTQLENEPPTAATSTSIDAGGCGQPPVVSQPDQPATCATQAEPAGTPEPQPSIAASDTASPPMQPPERSYEDVLKAAGLGELKLPGSLHEKLTDAGVNTVWDLERLRGEISQGKEKWPKGIGAAKITTLEDAILGWLTRNQSRWEKPQTVEVPTPTQTPTPEVKPEPASQVEEVKSLDADLDDL